MPRLLRRDPSLKPTQRESDRAGLAASSDAKWLGQRRSEPIRRSWQCTLQRTAHNVGEVGHGGALDAVNVGGELLTALGQPKVTVGSPLVGPTAWLLMTKARLPSTRPTRVGSTGLADFASGSALASVSNVRSNPRS